MEPGVTSKPGFDTRTLVGLVVVHDQMQVQLRWGFAIYPFKKTNKLLMPMPPYAVTNHLLIEHAKRRKERGCPTPFVFVRLFPTVSLLHRQPRLGSVQGLGLALLIYAQNQSLVRRVQIKTQHILQLLNKMLITVEIKGFDQMGFQIIRDAPVLIIEKE